MTLAELHTIIGNLMRETGKGNLEVRVWSKTEDYLTVEGVNFNKASSCFDIETEEWKGDDEQS